MVLATGTDVDIGLLGAARITRVIGQGGQGHVYEVTRPSGDSLALKWYRPQSATQDQFREIQTLIDFGSPHTRFLWPLSVARIDQEAGFGYVMPLRDQRFIELSYLLAGNDPAGKPLVVSFTATVSMCRQLAFSFLRLHARGLCYRDISFGNVFFEPDTGDVLICDNDNVGVDDGSGRVLGTPMFMAPEVVRDTTYHTLPSTDTDRHSLAVLLFYVLCVGHPFEGRRTEQGIRDPAWLQRHFGTDPLFCMHPDRDENRPPALVQKYWNLYPRFLRNLFVQAFVDGLDTPSHRVTEGQWIKAMDRLRDGMVQCANCDATGFWDPTEPDRPCAACQGAARPDFLLEIGRRKVAASPFATIRSDHLELGVDDAEVIGRVRRHPREPRRWGLSNMSGKPWTARYHGGDQILVEPGETIELLDGLRVRLESRTESSTVVVRSP
jgi:DNA-binding helix-hairpin-helix protein with protein kinase domain